MIDSIRLRWAPRHRRCRCSCNPRNYVVEEAEARCAGPW